MGFLQEIFERPFIWPEIREIRDSHKSGGDFQPSQKSLE